MVEIILKLNEGQIAYFSGFFLAQCYSPDRATRKAAIENYALLYSLTDSATKDELELLQPQIEKMIDNPELLKHIVDDIQNVINKIKGA